MTKQEKKMIVSTENLFEVLCELTQHDDCPKQLKTWVDSRRHKPIPLPESKQHCIGNLLPFMQFFSLLVSHTNYKYVDTAVASIFMSKTKPQKPEKATEPSLTKED
jgi:hypothetical protein